MLSKCCKKIPLATIYRKGINPEPISNLLTNMNASQSSSTELKEEAELGVDKLFPCDVLQAHWVSDIMAMCPKWITSASLVSMQIQIDCPLEYTKPMLLFLRNHQHSFFQQMDMLAVADHIGEPLRFELSYGLRNVMYWNNIRINTFVDELTHVPSVTDIYGSAEPLENKAFDMYGVFFKDHPDLRRIYTDYGFQGHPMRKDFPVTGYTEIRYDDSLRRIVYEPVEMAQELRKFDFLNPWYADDPRKETP
eukprot:487824_1